MKPLIEFNNVSKKYRIGLGSMSLRSAMSAIPKLFLKNRPNDNQDLWAIKDISFDISAGESIGILGHNGAGKTTILKLISEITYFKLSFHFSNKLHTLRRVILSLEENWVH